MRKRKTTEEFISDAKKVHGDKYDYSKVVYLQNKQRITIICPEHGEFEQIPSNHLKGFGCKKCSNQYKPTREEFIENANNVHNNKYDYSKLVYVNAKTKVTIVCPEHGEFSQNPSDHTMGKGCHSCGKSKKLTTSIFINRSIKIHDDKYSYEKSVYDGLYKSVIIICPIHGHFNQKPSEHLQGCGCPNCTKNGFQPSKPAYLYYLKVTTNDGQILYKLGITNRTVNERFNLTDLSKIEIVKQKLYTDGAEALKWETKLKRMYKEYQYKGPDILSSGNTELFTEDIIELYYKG